MSANLGTHTLAVLTIRHQLHVMSKHNNIHARLDCE